MATDARAQIIAAIDAAAAGKLVSTTPLFDADYPTTLARNAACWAAGFDLTCASPRIGTSGTKAVTLITPRHVLGLLHLSPGIGDAIEFVSSAGVAYSRTVSAIADDGDDHFVARLSGDVDPSIAPAVLLPDDWDRYIRASAKRLPIVRLNNRNATPNREDASLDRIGAIVSGLVAVTGQHPDYDVWVATADGDSASPCFLLGLTGQTVLLKMVGDADHLGEIRETLQGLVDQTGNPEGYEIGTARFAGYQRYSAMATATLRPAEFLPDFSGGTPAVPTSGTLVEAIAASDDNYVAAVAAGDAVTSFSLGDIPAGAVVSQITLKVADWSLTTSGGTVAARTDNLQVDINLDSGNEILTKVLASHTTATTTSGLGTTSETFVGEWPAAAINTAYLSIYNVNSRLGTSWQVDELWLEVEYAIPEFSGAAMPLRLGLGLGL